MSRLYPKPECTTMSTLPHFNSSLKTYPRATLLCFLRNSDWHMWTTECCELRFGSYVQDGELRIVAEYTTNDKDTQFRRESFGGSLNSQLVAIVQGWNHPNPSKNLVLDRRNRRVVVSIPIDDDSYFHDPRDEYIGCLVRGGAMIIADFRHGVHGVNVSSSAILPLAPPSPPTTAPAPPSPPTTAPTPKVVEERLSETGLLTDLSSSVDPEADESRVAYREGRLVQININTYERNRAARRACIAHYGSSCSVCGIDFAERYPGIGDGYIHVHHLVPLSSVGREYELNPVKDLIPVCPNCHEMLHQKDPPYTPDELRIIFRKGE